MKPQPLQILVSPLDWGLGHASRCIPLIRLLLETGHSVSIAGSGRSLMLLKKEFPTRKSIELQGFSPEFRPNGSMVIQLFWMLPAFLTMLVKENRKLKRLIKHTNFDVLISDNRYGLWHRKVRSILITHQVMLKTPKWLRFAEYPLYLISKLLISRFDECWIPDYTEKPGLSGDLSHKYSLPLNALFVGPLSRFRENNPLKIQKENGDSITVIISGTEPQRTDFENLVLKQLKGLRVKATIISGKTESNQTVTLQDNLTIIPSSTATEMRKIIEGSSLIICRSGYSSIMDMEAIRAKVLFVPTPGQTEQQYLAESHQHYGNALWKAQNELDLKTDIPEALKYRGFIKQAFTQELKAAVMRLAKK